jgi:hypothetical protein
MPKVWERVVLERYAKRVRECPYSTRQVGKKQLTNGVKMGNEHCDKCGCEIDINKAGKWRVVELRTHYESKDEFTSKRTYRVCEKCYKEIKEALI